MRKERSSEEGAAVAATIFAEIVEPRFDDEGEIRVPIDLFERVEGAFFAREDVFRAVLARVEGATREGTRRREPRFGVAARPVGAAVARRAFAAAASGEPTASWVRRTSATFALVRGAKRKIWQRERIVGSCFVALVPTRMTIVFFGGSSRVLRSAFAPSSFR